MRRISTATQATDLFGAGKHGFTAGEFATQVPPTKVTPEILNDLQEEVARAIEDAGLPLDTTYRLTAAIRQIAADSQPRNVITPSAISGAQTAYAPTGWSTAGVVRLSGGGAPNPLQGLSPSTPKLLVNVNASGGDFIRIHHESGSATAANRVATHTEANIDIAPGESLLIQYDATSARWRPVAPAARSMGTGSTDTTPIVLQANSITLNSANRIHVTGANGVEIEPLADYRYSAAKTVTRRFSALSGYALTDETNWSRSSGDRVTYAGTAGSWARELNGMIPDGATITEVKVFYSRTTGTVSLSFYETDEFNGSITSLESDVSMGTGSNTSATMTVSTPATIDTETKIYRLSVGASGGVTDLRIHGFEVTYTTTRMGQT